MINLQERTISYDDVCLVPAYSDLQSRSDADISFGEYSSVLINAPMIHTSSEMMLYYMLNTGMCPTIHRYFKTPDEQFTFACEGSGTDAVYDIYFAVGRDRRWIDTLINDHGVLRFCVDMAHGDSMTCVETVEYIRVKAPNASIMAGNVATGSGYERLIRAGADLIRVGVAGGSICSTAKTTAFGVPMMTSIMECDEAKKRVGGLLIADGGIRSAADILKAIAAGADMVMCGKLLASTDLAEGPFYNLNMVDVSTMSTTDSDNQRQIRFVEYAGMASHEMRMRNNTHRADVDMSVEGVCGVINYTGKTVNVIPSIHANLRAGLSYCGARNWTEFKENVVMRMMSTAGIIEKETHLDGGVNL